MFRHFVGAGWKRGDQPDGGVKGVKHHRRQLRLHSQPFAAAPKIGNLFKKMAVGAAVSGGG
jgi:hypothetical protein